MAKLHLTKWKVGNYILSGTPTTTWVQKTVDGWFAKIEQSNYKSIHVSGPWDTQQEAEFNLLDSLSGERQKEGEIE